MSDIPQQENKSNEKTMTTADKREKLFDDLVGYLPPPPEDQFTMTGDIGVLFLYSFMGHALDDYVVKSVFDSSDSARQAIETLDPLQEVVHIQTPVWLDSTPQLTDQIISLNAQETLMKTWGPLFSSAGVSSIALCSCWLLAGYLHRSFSYENSIDCDAASALQKTLVTWVTMIGILALLTLGSNALVGQTPLLQAWVGCHCLDFLFTKDDMLFLVDSGTVLFAWRYMANIIAQYLR
eukprot:scaffold9078_cov129-Cylindrotheca_fusiformis.AAC.9